MEKEFYLEGLSVVNALTEARKKIATIDHPDFQVKRNRLILQLTEMINPIRVTQMGLEPEKFETDSYIPEVCSNSKPLTKVLGVDLKTLSDSNDAS
jgi:hypothetical protein